MILSQLTTIFSGHPFRGAILPRPGTGFYAIRTKDLSTDNTVNWSTIVEAAPTSRRTPRWLSTGDILVALRRRPHVAILLDHVPKSAVASPHFMVIRVTRTDILLPEYLVLLLNHDLIPSKSQTASHSVRPTHLSVTEFANLSFDVPSLESQKQIAALAKQLNQLRTSHMALATSITTILQSIARNPHRMAEFHSSVSLFTQQHRQQLSEGYQALGESQYIAEPTEIREPGATYHSYTRRLGAARQKPISEIQLNSASLWQSTNGRSTRSRAN